MNVDENEGDRMPLGDLTNITSQDARERRRQRDRAKRASMSAEERNERNKKRRESYQLKKGQPLIDASLKGGEHQLNNENVQPVDSDDWLHSNMSYHTQNFVGEARSKELPGRMELPCSSQSRSPTVQIISQVDKRNNYFRKTYENMTPAAKIARRERQKIHDRTSERMEASKDYKRRQRELKSNTLNLDSIAMENPKYIPEIVWPTVDASGSNGSPVSARDWVIPELSATHFLPASTQTDDVETSDRSPRQMRYKRHVPSGERQSLLVRRNQLFEATIARNLAAQAEDSGGGVVEVDTSPVGG